MLDSRILRLRRCYNPLRIVPLSQPHGYAASRTETLHLSQILG
ncbi:hypothetical protein [Nostoc parmelioides]|nr:hypothetical protein [Nostoc parmelioides]